MLQRILKTGRTDKIERKLCFSYVANDLQALVNLCDQIQNIQTYIYKNTFQLVPGVSWR